MSPLQTVQNPHASRGQRSLSATSSNQSPQFQINQDANLQTGIFTSIFPSEVTEVMTFQMTDAKLKLIN